jgi:glutaminyl-tRNA synthetase
MSKRKLKALIDQSHVSGWDDPRMPTISGLRRRGYTPESLQNFVNTAGVAKRDNIIDVSLLEFCVRDHLNKIAPRVMAVLNPVKLTIKNYPDGQTEMLKAENNPEDEKAGFREVPFSGSLYIEREDFKEEANRKFFRLTLGKEVRLKNAYIIKGEEVVKDAQGNITEIICSYDPLSKSGSGTEESQRKVKGTLHWVSRAHAHPIKVNMYDRLFYVEEPDKNKDENPARFINPESFSQVRGYIEPAVVNAAAGEKFQFQRLGYFILENKADEHLVFNKTVGLRDTWKKS